ncbi:MAG: AAA family ATPase, partial [Bdellovibrionaceae bacterium]|nr:AAA family ATPase [Pseudobdellovibrionaceae bacterium]
MSSTQDSGLKRRKLPIGIQTFSKLREQGCYYVDKTPMVARLAEQGGAFFLSRPRRFGKSLFLDTLAEAFAGRKELFEGLYLENHWDWSKKHPVIRVSFVEGVLRNRQELSRHIRRILQENATRLGVHLSNIEDEAGSFAELITRAAHHHGQKAVVVVDEYDKPILDHLTEPDVAKEMREGLRNLYS